MFMFLLALGFLVFGVLLLAGGILLACSSLATLAMVIGFFWLAWKIAGHDWGIGRRWRAWAPPKPARKHPTVQQTPSQYIGHRHPRTSLDDPQPGARPYDELRDFDHFGML